MTSGWGDNRWIGAALLSLVPWVAFVAATLLSGFAAPEWITIDESKIVSSAPWYIGFISLPSFLPLAAAMPGKVRWVVLAIMTAVACFAGYAVRTTDDAQAGLAVLWVPFVAFPLAAVLGVGRLVFTSRRTSTARSAS